MSRQQRTDNRGQHQSSDNGGSLLPAGLLSRQAKKSSFASLRALRGPQLFSSIRAHSRDSRAKSAFFENSRFMSIAAGSASEVEYQLLLARDLKYIPDETYRGLDQEINEVKRMLNALIRKIASSDNARRKS